MDSPHLSIVVPTHERRESVLRLLRALHAQTAPAALFEVVVAIDGSRDGTSEAVAAYAAPFVVRSLWQAQRGRAAACNAGARSAAGAIVAFLDDDMEPTPGFVAGHLAAHGDGHRPDGPDVMLGVVGAAPIVVPHDALPVVTYRARGFARKLERLAAKREGLAFNDVYTGNFSIRRDVLLAAGGYDEEFTLYGHEDYELALRLGRAGVRFVFDPLASARQHYTKDLRSLAANIGAEGQTAVLFALKQPEVVSMLYLSSFAERPWRARARLRALLALSRVYRALPARTIARLERLGEHTGPAGSPDLFARYDRLFDLLYWLGVERALDDAAAPRGVPFDAVAHRIASAARRRGAAR